MGNKNNNLQSVQPPVRLSQCMIVKNEERNIRNALGWARNIAFEQIVVDTGSTDHTVKLAKKAGARVFHFEWTNDFAAAKNYAIEQASGNWIAFLDADEYLSPADTKKLVLILDQINTDTEFGKSRFAISCPWAHVDEKGKVFSVNSNERVFRSFMRYSGKIHEHLDIRPENLARADDITIIHTGYSKTAVKASGKLDRNVKMLRAELAERPDDLNIKAYLAESLSGMPDVACLAEAESLFREVIDGLNVSCLLKKRAYKYLINKLSENPEKLSECEQLSRKALSIFPGELDLEYYLASILNKKNEFGAAWELLKRCEVNLTNAAAIDVSEVVTATPSLLFVQMANAALGLGDAVGAARYAAMALKENKTQAGVLKPYIIILLNGGSSGEEIFSQLSGLYDMGDTNDLLFIASAAKDCGAISLARIAIGAAGRILGSRNGD